MHPAPIRAAQPLPVPPPSPAETTLPRLSPWPFVATPASDVPDVPAPEVAGTCERTDAHSMRALRDAAPEATSAIPVERPRPEAPAAGPAPERTRAFPQTSPSFALSRTALPFGGDVPSPRRHASGRHAVPEQESRRDRRRWHRAGTGEQPAVALGAADNAAAREHSGRRRHGRD